MFLEMLDCFPDHARRLGQMMHRLDVDVIALAQRRHGVDFAKVRRSCRTCLNAAICDRSHESWLAGKASDGPESFCPSARLLSDYRRARG